METIYRLLEAKTTAQAYQHKDDPASGTSPPMRPIDFFLTEIDEMLKEKGKTIQLLANALKEILIDPVGLMNADYSDIEEYRELAEKHLNAK
ncbi:hypothetical protein KA005_15530 [bacterium]|nr:hypothetical protein [bacterium]